MLNFKATLLSLFGELGNYLAILFKDALHKELALALPIATRVIAQVAMDPTLLSGSDKRDAAIGLALAELGKSQITIGISVLNLAIELAVQKSKAEAPAIAAPVVAK